MSKSMIPNLSQHDDNFSRNLTNAATQNRDSNDNLQCDFEAFYVKQEMNTNPLSDYCDFSSFSTDSNRDTKKNFQCDNFEAVYVK